MNGAQLLVVHCDDRAACPHEVRSIMINLSKVRIRGLALCFVSIALIPVLAYRSVGITPRGLAALLLALVGGAYVVIIYRYHEKVRGQNALNHVDVEVKKAIHGAVRILQIAVFVLPVMLIAGLWVTRGGPLVPRVIGAGINISATWWFLTLLRRAYRKSEEQRKIKSNDIDSAHSG